MKLGLCRLCGNDGTLRTVLFSWSNPQNQKRPRVERTWGRPTSGEVGTPWVVNGGHPKRLWNRSPQRSFVPTRGQCGIVTRLWSRRRIPHSAQVTKGPGQCRGRVCHSQGESQ